MTTTTQPAQLLLTVREAADAMRVSERTLFDMTKRGDLPSIRIGTRGVRYSVAAIQAWIDRQTSQV